MRNALIKYFENAKQSILKITILETAVPTAISARRHVLSCHLVNAVVKSTGIESVQRTSNSVIRVQLRTISKFGIDWIHEHVGSRVRANLVKKLVNG